MATWRHSHAYYYYYHYYVCILESLRLLINVNEKVKHDFRFLRTYDCANRLLFNDLLE